MSTQDDRALLPNIYPYGNNDIGCWGLRIGLIARLAAIRGVFGEFGGDVWEVFVWYVGGFLEVKRKVLGGKT